MEEREREETLPVQPTWSPSGRPNPPGDLPVIFNLCQWAEGETSHTAEHATSCFALASLPRVHLHAQEMRTTPSHFPLLPLPRPLPLASLPHAAEHTRDHRSP